MSTNAPSCTQLYALAWASSSLSQGPGFSVFWLTWPTEAPGFAHLAKWAGDLGGSSSIHGPSSCASPRPNQLPVQSNKSVLPPTKSSISGWWHPARSQTLVVKLSLCHLSNRQRRKFQALANECCILHGNSFRWQQHSHHSGEALYDGHLQKFGCRPFLHPKVGSRIVYDSSDGDSTPITPKNHGMFEACRHLGVCHSLSKGGMLHCPSTLRPATAVPSLGVGHSIHSLIRWQQHCCISLGNCGFAAAESILLPHRCHNLI